VLRRQISDEDVRSLAAQRMQVKQQQQQQQHSGAAAAT
jgi:hypothetical protein